MLTKKYFNALKNKVNADIEYDSADTENIIDYYCSFVYFFKQHDYNFYKLLTDSHFIKTLYKCGFDFYIKKTFKIELGKFLLNKFNDDFNKHYENFVKTFKEYIKTLYNY